MRSLIASLAVLLALSPVFVYAKGGFVVTSFDADIAIQTDGSVRIVETIDVDFRDALHGIYRDMPLSYRAPDGTHYSDIEIQTVTDGEKAHQYEIYENASNLRIRIGDPNVEITGEERYVITYTVAGVVVPFDAYDELYWNVTGGEWEVPIERAAASVRIPAGEIIQVACFIGEYGSSDECAGADSTSGVAHFSAGRALAPGEGMTVAVGFPKDIVPILTVEGPAPFDLVGFMRQFIPAIVAVLVIGTGFVFWLWRTYGRDRYYARKNLHDPDAKEKDMPLGADETIVVEYDPPEQLRPAEIGLIIDESADTLDISATIVDMAVRGFLTIREVPKTWMFGSKDYVLAKTAKHPESLLRYERLLYDKLFEARVEVSISDLKEKFYTSLAEVKKALYEHGVEKKFFVRNPSTVRNTYRALALLAIVTGAGIGFMALASEAIRGWLFGLGAGLALNGVALMIVASYMPRRTAHGRELYRQARGYKIFVSGTEKYRQPFFERENIFMEVLPYAMVFGVTSQLAKAMRDMGIQPQAPAWYVGATPFNVAVFSDSMNSLQASLSSAMAAMPSGSGSGGGGFSGGGFGGGGGGGW